MPFLRFLPVVPVVPFVITRSVIAALAAALCCQAGAQPASPARATEIITLAPGVHLLPGRFERGRQPDGNSLLLEGPDGTAVIDTGRHLEHTGALAEWLRQRPKPPRAIVNTHWHLDHLGGNILLRREWPTLQVHASNAVTKALGGPMQRSVEELNRLLADPATDANTRTVARIDLALLEQRPLLAPTHEIGAGDTALTLVGRPLRIGLERQAVSGGDVWVLDVQTGTLAVGDVVTLPVPFFDTACADNWRAALGRLEALPFERVVPGHGPVLSRSDFQRYRRAFDRLLVCAAGDTSTATCAGGWIDDLGPLLPPDSERVVGGMLGHYFVNRLRAPEAQRNAFCQPG